MKHIDIVFDGPPIAHESGRFVEVEDSEGKSISIGTWVKREDGYWALQIADPRTLGNPHAILTQSNRCGITNTSTEEQKMKHELHKKLKLWEYFKAEEEGKQIQILISEEEKWVSWRLDAHTGAYVYITRMIEEDKLRIKAEPVQLTLMIKANQSSVSGFAVAIKENGFGFPWIHWEEATFKDGKLIVEVPDEA